MNLLEIEQSKQISIKCKELLLFLTDENEISFVKSIYNNSEKSINEFNNSNITTVNPTPTEIGKFHSAVKSYARSYFKDKIKKVYPEYLVSCLNCQDMEKKADKENDDNFKIGIYNEFKDYEYCECCDKKWNEYDIKYDEVRNSNTVNTDFLYQELNNIKIDEYWMNAYILLSRKYWDITQIDELGKATKEIIKTEILKQVSTIKLN